MRQGMDREGLPQDQTEKLEAFIKRGEGDVLFAARSGLLHSVMGARHRAPLRELPPPRRRAV
jgi:hypothetical protein